MRHYLVKLAATEVAMAMVAAPSLPSLDLELREDRDLDIGRRQLGVT